MRKYEMMYIIRPDIEEEAVNKMVEKLKGIIENDGTITTEKMMGKRRLAYEIEKFREGTYVLVNFEAPSDTVKELDRVIRISDEVIRHLIIKDEVA